MNPSPCPPPPAPCSSPPPPPAALAVELLAPPLECAGVKLHPYAVARKLMLLQIIEGLSARGLEPQVTLQSWLLFRVLQLDEAALLAAAFKPEQFLHDTVALAATLPEGSDEEVFNLYVNLSKKRGRGHGGNPAGPAAPATAEPVGAGPAAALGQ